MSLATLIELSHRYGSDKSYTVAGGGNTSFKENGVMYVKASGRELADIDESGFVKMSVDKLLGMFDCQYPEDEKEREAWVLEDMHSARLRGEKGRPSVEALLHALFPFKYVVHLHPAMANGVLCCDRWEQLCADGLKYRGIAIGETKPGYILALEAKKAMDAFKKSNGYDCRLLGMQNHGVFFAGDSVEEVNAAISRTMDLLDSRVRFRPVFDPAEADRSLAARIAPAIRGVTGSTVALFESNITLRSFLESKEAFAPISAPFTPDHIVYCGAEPLFVGGEDDEAIYAELETKAAAYKEKWGVMPKTVCVRGLGAFLLASSRAAAERARDTLNDMAAIAVYTRSFGEPLHMGDELRRFICSWEVESYRASALGKAGGSLSGKIAIVTGGAQGFGLGIAEGLLADGAHVVIADLNEQTAEASRADLCARFGEGRVIACKTDVSSEESVQTMLEDTALAFGGVDIFISNAGIVKSGGLEAMELRTFELMTKVNYTAFFICTKLATRMMKIQNRFAKEGWLDMIQINSKSGLEGSNKNFAYAGGKFGGIGLVESFALELVESRIKVNAVCPGNYYGGPLWGDPVKGLFVQYLNSGKVPGAKTVEDVRKFYEAKAPMRRGCEPSDVVRAVEYIVAQDYETGQAVPVTGGQKMLK